MKSATIEPVVATSPAQVVIVPPNMKARVVSYEHVPGEGHAGVFCFNSSGCSTRINRSRLSKVHALRIDNDGKTTLLINNEWHELGYVEIA